MTPSGLTPPSKEAHASRAVIAGYHRHRLWTAAVAALVFAGVDILSAVPVDGLRLAALFAATAAIHAAWRVVRPTGFGVDAVAVDATMILAFLATFRPPFGVMGVAMLYVAIPAVLFLSPRFIGWMISYMLIGAAAVRWGIPAQQADREGLGPLAALLAVAGIPTLAWMIRTVATSMADGRAAMRDLGETSARFERFFHRSAVAMFRTDTTGKLLDANRSLLDLMGAEDVASLASRPSTDFYLDPLDRARLIAAVKTAGEAHGFEAHMRRMDGTPFWARISTWLVAAGDGTVVESVMEDITVERSRVQELQAAATALSQVRSAVVLTDADGMVGMWNRAAETFFGHAASDALGRYARDLLPAGDPAVAEEAASEVREKGTWQGEVSLSTMDGGTRETVFTVTRLFEPDGTRDGFAMVWADITDIVESRRELTFQADILAQVRNAVVVSDMTGAVTYWNAGAERIYGWAAAEALGRSVGELVVSADGLGSFGDFPREHQADHAWDGEMVLLRKDGTRFSAMGGTAPIHGPDGAPAGIVAVTQDVTARREAERAAREQGDLARAVLNAIRFPVAVVDLEGEIIAVNQAWDEVSRLNGGDLARTGIGVNYLQVCDRAAAEDPESGTAAEGIRRVLAGSADSFGVDYECHVPGEQRWFRMGASPVPGVGAVISHWNVTAEQRVRRTLEEVVASKDEFLTAVAHHLRTPLTAVVGFSEHLRSVLPEESETASMLDTIVDQAHEVADLVEDLLLVGRLDSGTVTCSIEPTGVADTVGRVVRQFVNGGSAAIEVSVHPVLQVAADPLRTRQILRNLVSNAVRHGASPMAVRARRAAGKVHIDVVDSGEGAPGYVEASLFEPYSHIPSGNGSPATVGLGLHVAQRLARIMDGDVTYRHDATGTTFTLTLPAAG